MINVTKTYLPDKTKYMSYIDKIYDSSWITNNGPLVRELEERLADYLGVKNIVLVSNGTAALEIAYRTLGLKGFVITTPFSFVATTSSLVTNALLPIFCDIDEKTLNINPVNIEAQITSNTSAIVPVHVFGNTCKVEVIETIAKKHNLKIVYDASHAFGVKHKGQSVLNYGDISTLSFHATKLFHTIEGGAIVINDDALVEKARYLINFGIENQDSIPELGINAKMNEFEAAMGLCMLDEMENILNERESLYSIYEKSLSDIVEIQKRNTDGSNNYGYFPILLKDEEELLKVQNKLNQKNIFPRRYFNTSLDTLPYIEPKQYMPISRDIASRVLCLPIYPQLQKAEQENIILTIRETLENL